MYNKAPFATWVPKPLMLLLIVVFTFPMIIVSGVYIGNSANIAGGLAVYGEYISLANNASVIGVCLGLIILLRIKMRFRSKEIVAGSAIILAILSIVCGTTDSPYVLVAASFLIGFFKIFPMLEMIIILMAILSPSGHKGIFYAIFTPITLLIGQVANYYLASMFADYSYQAPYYFMAIAMLVIAALSLIFQHNDRFSFKMPLYQIDWLSLLLLGGAGMSFNVFFVFMKQQGWFSSPYILGSLICGVLLLGFTIYRQKFIKRKMINFGILYKKPNILHSIVLLLFLGILLASAGIYSQYTMGVLGYNSQVSAGVNMWMIPGAIVAGAYGLLTFKKNWNIKAYISVGYISFFLHILCLYLLIQPQMNIEYLEYAMIIKGFAMGILFIGIWYYASLDLSINDLLGVIAILLMIRSFIATALGGAIVGWVSYQGQWQSLNDLSMHLDTGIIQNGMAINKNISINALMASGKVVLGAMCWLIVPILIFVLTHHYGRSNYRRAVFFRKIIKGNSLRGYQVS